jgi:hypothetical protein
MSWGWPVFALALLGIGLLWGELESPSEASNTPSVGYRIAGGRGIIVTVAIDIAHQTDEEVYRLAASEACESKKMCQVSFWVGDAPRTYPITEQDAERQIAQWNENRNTGLRRWMVKCSTTSLFSTERECM